MRRTGEPVMGIAMEKLGSAVFMSPWGKLTACADTDEDRRTAGAR